MLTRGRQGSEVFSFNSSLANYSKKPITASIRESERKLFLLHSLTPKKFNTTKVTIRNQFQKLKLGEYTASYYLIKSQQNENEKRASAVI